MGSFREPSSNIYSLMRVTVRSSNAHRFKSQMKISSFFRKARFNFSRFCSCRKTFEKHFEKPAFSRQSRSYRVRRSCTDRPFRRLSDSRSTFESAFMEVPERRKVFDIQPENFLYVPRIFNCSYLERVIVNIEAIYDFLLSRNCDFREQLI